MKATLSVDNTYADGYQQTIVYNDVEIPTPTDLTDPDYWASDHLYEYTGTGTGRENVDAVYTVTIVAADIPELVGYEIEFGI